MDDTWVSYEIHPETPPGGVRLEDLFGPGHRLIQQRLALRCRDLGLPFEGPEVLSNSRLAIEAAEFARDAGRHGVFHRAVLAACFGSSRDIGSVDVLRDIAEDSGLDGGALGEALAAGHHSERRLAARAEAAKLGVTAVPTFMLPPDMRVVGAQPVGEFRRLLDGHDAKKAPV